MIHRDATKALEPMFSCAECGERTNSTERLFRRLVAERRIRFVKVGKYVRIPESALLEYIANQTVEASA